MTYGLSTRALIEDGAAEQFVHVEARRSTAPAWRVLSEACRLEAVEQALLGADDRIDGYPIAL